MSIHDEDEQSLIIEPPKQEKAKITAHLSSWEYQIYSQEPQEAKIYFVASEVYLRNLFNKVEEPRLNEAQRKHFGPECVILQQLQLEWIVEDGVHRLKDTYRASISMHYQQYRGLDIELRLGELDITSDDTVQGRLIYYNQGDQINYKTYRMDFMTSEPNALSFRIDDKMFDQYFKPKLAIEFTIKKQPTRERRFKGIQNQGNTCYMNSTLQILYFLRPLRKTIIEFEGKSQLMSTIKRIFIDLLDTSSDASFSRSVNASDLLSAYGRFPDPRKQQDIHEFLLGFLDELQGECPQLKELWIGHGKQILSSCDSEKPYKNSIAQQYSEIDLLLQDHKGNTLGQMSLALQMLLLDELVEDKIETDQYGKVEVKKTRLFNELPNVVFFNLKRYKYQKSKNRSVKILTDFQYPPSISLAFLQQTPTGEEEDYVLFGVAVHRGQTYNSGHYYAFVNTSPDIDKPHWVKFNDSFVHVSSQETALSFKGGKHKSFVWSKDYQRFIEKEYVSQQTAYMLVYVRRDKFKEYQVIKTSIPRNWISSRRVEEQRDNGGKNYSMQLLILENNMENDIFDDSVPTIPIDLKENESLIEQLNKMGPGLLGCKVASIWKVSRRRRKVKLILNYIDLPPTPSRIFQYKRGRTIPDYILVVPDSIPTFHPFAIQNSRESLGIINTMIKDNDNVRMSFSVIGKSHLQDYQTQQEKRVEKRGFIEDKDRFTHDWTDYCTLRFD